MNAKNIPLPLLAFAICVASFAISALLELPVLAVSGIALPETRDSIGNTWSVVFLIAVVIGVLFGMALVLRLRRGK